MRGQLVAIYVCYNVIIGCVESLSEFVYCSVKPFSPCVAQLLVGFVSEKQRKQLEYMHSDKL